MGQRRIMRVPQSSLVVGTNVYPTGLVGPPAGLVGFFGFASGSDGTADSRTQSFFRGKGASCTLHYVREISGAAGVAIDIEFRSDPDHGNADQETPVGDEILNRILFNTSALSSLIVGDDLDVKLPNSWYLVTNAFTPTAVGLEIAYSVDSVVRRRQEFENLNTGTTVAF